MGWGRPRSPAVPPLGWGPRQDPLGCPESARTASRGHTAAGANFRLNVLFGAIILNTAISAAFPPRGLGWGHPRSPVVPLLGRGPRRDPLGCPESARTTSRGHTAAGANFRLNVLFGGNLGLYFDTMHGTRSGGSARSRSRGPAAIGSRAHSASERTGGRRRRVDGAPNPAAEGGGADPARHQGTIREP